MVYTTFSKRQRAEQQVSEEIYIYDEIPTALRIQIIHIWFNSIGSKEENCALVGERVRSSYECLVQIIREELGVFILPPSTKYSQNTALEELIDYFLKENEVERVLDVIELSFQYIDNFIRDFNYQGKRDSNEITERAINDVNIRFKEHSIGYRFDSRRLIRIDSEFLHVKVVKPALKLLSNPEYAGAQDEFLKACDHYKSGRKKEVLGACFSAFESMMKLICKKRGWEHPINATASPLIKICIQNRLIPLFLQSKSESLQSLLESGIPTIGNKLGRHGQGAQIVEVPDYIAAYALHETASTLILLHHAEADLKQSEKDSVDAESLN